MTVCLKIDPNHLNPWRGCCSLSGGWQGKDEADKVVDVVWQ